MSGTKRVMKLSKRKLKSYQRAEMIAREVRYQLSRVDRRDENQLMKLLLKWMNVTGNIKYQRPKT